MRLATATSADPHPNPAEKSGNPSGKRTGKAAYGTRLPDDWQLPKSWGEWAPGEIDHLTEADVRREAACFADYWHAKAGANARKADWEATWRTWIRKSEEFRRQKNRNLPAARASPLASAKPDDPDSWIRPASLQAREEARKELFGVVIDERA